MEVIRGPQHAAFVMNESTRVGEARRHAAALALRGGLDEVQAGRVALVVTELGNNLVRHATGGSLLVALYPERAEVEIISIDRGPGIPDVARSMSDGFSTGGTPGTGLGAVRRQAQDFHLHSSVPGGTVIVARVRAAAPRPNVQATPQAAPPALRACGISVALAGEALCGDGWAAAFHDDHATVLVADGLGHGPDAAAASNAALDVFCAEPSLSPRALVGEVHLRLRSTRGAAITALHLDAGARRIRCSGAGNAMARVISGDSDKTLLTQHGTAGLQIRTPEENQLDWPPHAIVIVHTDGIESRWKPGLLAPVLTRDPTLAAALLLRDHSRGRDDATVVVLGRRG